MKYDIRQTNIAKGTALLLLLWHHLFYRSPEYYGLFTSVRVIDGIPLESYIARYCKVCVALFFFLSAYGMFKSLQKNSRRDPQGGAAAQVRFVWRHLVRLLMTVIDILEKHTIITCRQEDLPLLMKIRNGGFMAEDGTIMPEFYEILDHYERRFQEAAQKTTLPDNPDMGKIGAFVARINRHAVMEDY